MRGPESIESRPGQTDEVCLPGDEFKWKNLYIFLESDLASASCPPGKSQEISRVQEAVGDGFQGAVSN
jgi:hypothetical protein